MLDAGRFMRAVWSTSSSASRAATVLAAAGLMTAGGATGCSSGSDDPASGEDTTSDIASGDDGAGGSDGADGTGAADGAVDGTDVTDGSVGCQPVTPASASPQVAYDVDAKTGCHFTVSPGSDDQAAVLTAIVAAQPGQTVCLAAGTFVMTGEVTIDMPDLVLRGASREGTILDFSGQKYGGNGISARGDRFHVESLTVKNTPGDGIRASGIKDVVMKDVAVIWDAPASPTNGAYGLYPVQCDGVLIQGCLVVGASDAGVYVGQSTHIRVDGNESWGNVAGLEIENSSYAEVLNNNVHDNTGGILVFNLPGLPIKEGRFTNVHDNQVLHNNLVNFAPPGNLVGKVPSGTGMFILSADDNEIHDNVIKENRSIGVLTVYYDTTLFGTHDDPEFDPYAERNYIHDNTLEGNGADPQGILKVLIAGGMLTEPLAQIGDSGCVDPLKPGGATENGNCFTVPAGTDFLNIDLCNSFKNVSHDPAPFACVRTALGAQDGKCTGDKCGSPAVAGPRVAKTTCDLPYPKLSAYEFFVSIDYDGVAALPTALVPIQPKILPYEVNAPLWADHAGKGRLIVVPAGQGMTPTDDVWTFPAGTVLVKTFYLDTDRRPDHTALSDDRKIETRLLILGADGWTAHTYLWNDAQTDATLTIAGGPVDVAITDEAGAAATQTYLVPNVIQCGSCHSKNNVIEPLGLTTRQLARSVERQGATVQQLDWLVSQAVLQAAPAVTSPLVNPYGTGDVAVRARSFLEANCAHCHRDGGSAGVTGLWLRADETDLNHLGFCKPPTAAGAGAGKNLYDIVPGDPDASILAYRLASTNPAIKMPELPNLVVDQAGLAVVRDWIAGLTPKGCP